MDHDAAHKYLYMLAPVVADMLRLVVPEWADDLDLAAIEDVSAEYLDEDHRKRLGDMVWKVRFREGQLADVSGRTSSCSSSFSPPSTATWPSASANTPACCSTG